VELDARPLVRRLAVYGRLDDGRRLSGVMQPKDVVCGRRRRLQLLASSLLGVRRVVETASQLAVLQHRTVPRLVKKLLRRELCVYVYYFHLIHSLFWPRVGPGHPSSPLSIYYYYYYY